MSKIIFQSIVSILGTYVVQVNFFTMIIINNTRHIT